MQEDGYVDACLKVARPLYSGWSGVEGAPSQVDWNRYLAWVYQHVVADPKAVVEYHHVYPKEQFPDHGRSPWNLAALSPRDHFKAHRILAAIVTRFCSVHTAFLRMCGKTSYFGGVPRDEVPGLEDAYVKAKELQHKSIQVRHKDGSVERVSKKDARVLSGALQHFNQGKVTVRDVATGTFLMVDHKDSRIAAGQLEIPASGMTIVVDPATGVNQRVSKDDPRFLSGEFAHVNRGTTRVVDLDGRGLRVKLDDPRLLTGELKKVNGLAGKTSVIDPTTGQALLVDRQDPRFLSGELQHVNKGTVRVRDTVTGNVFRAKKDDPRYLSGELVLLSNKGMKFPTPAGFVHANKGRVVAFSPDGKRFIVGLDDPRLASGSIAQRAKKPRGAR